jgi:hypothetical protein
MQITAKFGWIFLVACMLVFLSLSAFARALNARQDQGTAQTQSVQKAQKQNAERSSGKEIGKGGQDIGKGAGKGAESLGKGAAPAPPAIWLPCTLAMPLPISAKAPRPLARTSESAPEKAWPRWAKEPARELGSWARRS